MDNNATLSASGISFDPEEQTLFFEPDVRRKVIIIAGPTACGKTDLGISIAKAVGGEIISCDSMQLYRGADIGSAKPTPEQLREVPHHLINIRNIDEPFNVVDFYREAKEAYEKIVLRGGVPILVGGAGFYMQTFMCGPPQGPPSDQEVRRRLESDCDKFGPEMLYDKLSEIDPDYAQSITFQDRHKIIRALEIMTISGKKVTEIPKPSLEDLPRNIHFHCWFTYYPKPILYERIEERCDEMIEKGLIEEVINLREVGLLENPPAAKSIGYRQALEFLESAQTEEDWQEFVTSFKRFSRQYAKRQFTWFRKEALFRWLDLSQCSPQSAAEIIIQDFEQS